MNQQRNTGGIAGRRIGSVRGGIMSLALVMAMGGSVFPTGAVAQAQFSQIEVRGNQRIEGSTVLSYAGIETGQPVTAGQLNAAQQRILASGLFESVQIRPTQGTLVIEVIEFPTINQVSIEGNRRLNNEVLESLITSQPRRVYSPSTAIADARAITDAYFQAGRVAASVEPRIIARDQNRVDLVFEVTESGVVEVERIGFVGNRSFSDRRLRQALGTKQAGLFRQIIRRDSFVEDRIQFDRQVLTDFYRSRGFVDFEVLSVTPEFSRERDAFFLTFNVREGQRFTLGDVSVTTDVPGIDLPAFERVVRARTGQTYAPNRIDDTVARLERSAIEQGFDFIRADPVITRNERDLTLDVAFNLTRGPRILVERIDIEGNATTLDQVIRRQFRVVEGDPFNPREIRDSAERIRALGFFTEADVTTREGTAPDRVIVDVNVDEQPTGSLTLGGSYSLDEGFGFAIGLSERNFLGRGQFLSVSLSGGIDNNNSSISFVEPSLLGRQVQGGIDVYFRSTNSFNADFNTEQLGFSPSIGFPISDNGRLNLTYQLSRDEISNVQRGNPDVPGDNGSSAIIQREEGRLITSSVGYNYSFNSQRAGLDPNTRITLDFGQRIAGLGGDTQFVETTVSAGYQTKVLSEEVGVSATIRGAALNFTDGNSRVIDRYRGRGFARGFTANGIGPRDLTATNEDALGGNYAAGVAFEADFPLGLPEEYGIRGGVFYDLGSIWGLDDTAGTAGEVDDSFRLRQVVGATIFWTTPIGPLRFDFTRALQKEDYDDERTFDFRISTRF